MAIASTPRQRRSSAGLQLGSLARRVASTASVIACSDAGSVSSPDRARTSARRSSSYWAWPQPPANWTTVVSAWGRPAMTRRASTARAPLQRLRPVGQPDVEAAGEGGLGRDQVQEMLHALDTVEQGVVHVDVDHPGTALDLVARDLERGLEVARLDQAAAAGRAGDVGALADVHEARLGADRERLRAGQAQARRRLGRGARAGAGDRVRDRGDVLRGRAAATADDVDPRPARAHSAISSAVRSGLCSYSPSSFGRQRSGGRRRGRRRRARAARRSGAGARRRARSGGPR